MANTERMITFERYEEHKGFYNCAEGEKALCNICLLYTSDAADEL